MPLLNEGTTVSRPVLAYDMGNNIYKIIGTEQGLKPEDLDEEWLFPVGSYVACRTIRIATDTVLIANNSFKINTKNKKDRGKNNVTTQVL